MSTLTGIADAVNLRTTFCRSIYPVLERRRTKIRAIMSGGLGLTGDSSTAPGPCVDRKRLYASPHATRLAEHGITWCSESCDIYEPSGVTNFVHERRSDNIQLRADHKSRHRSMNETRLDTSRLRCIDISSSTHKADASDTAADTNARGHHNSIDIFYSPSLASLERALM